MNEKIKQLADEAHRYSHRHAVGPNARCEVFEEKFTELIVQDCLDAIVASKYRPSDEKDLLMFHAGLFTAIDAIKQRFGYK